MMEGESKRQDMKLITENIDEAKWKSQAERFSKITDITKRHTFPKTDVTNIKAEICMTVEQSLLDGLKARVVYTQYFEVDEGGTPVTYDHVVVDYYEKMTKAEVKAMLDHYDLTVPSEITNPLERLEWMVQRGFIDRVVQKNTFDGLPESDYTFIPD